MVQVFSDVDVSQFPYRTRIKYDVHLCYYANAAELFLNAVEHVPHSSSRVTLFVSILTKIITLTTQSIRLFVIQGFTYKSKVVGLL